MSSTNTSFSIEQQCLFIYLSKQKPELLLELMEKYQDLRCVTKNDFENDRSIVHEFSVICIVPGANQRATEKVIERIREETKRKEYPILQFGTQFDCFEGTPLDQLGLVECIPSEISLEKLELKLANMAWLYGHKDLRSPIPMNFMVKGVQGPKGDMIADRSAPGSEEIFYVVKIKEEDLDQSHLSFISPSVNEVSGLDSDSLVNGTYHWFDFIHPDDLDEMLSNVEQMIRSKDPVTVIYRFRDIRTGKYKWFEDYICPVDNEYGTITEFYGAIKDITYVKHTEQRIKDSEKRLKEIYEQATIGIAQISKEGHLLDVNETYAEMLGFSKDEMIGISYFSFFPKENYAKLANWLVKFNSTKGFSITEEQRNIDKNGNEISIHLRMKSVETDGNEQYLLAIVEDISDRKEQEKQIRVLSRFPEENPNPVLRFDKNNELIFMNQKAEALIEVLNAKGFSLISDQFVEYLKTAREGISQGNLEIQFGTLWMSFTFSAVKENADVYVHGIDITRNKRDELVREVSFNIAAQASRRIVDLKQICEFTHNELKKLLDVEQFYIALYDEHEDVISFPFYHDEKAKDGYYSDRAFGKGLPEYVLKKKKPFLLTQKDILELQMAGEINPRRDIPLYWLGVPLKGDGKTIGLIAIHTYSVDHYYSEEELAILRFISTQIARVIENQLIQESLAESENYFRSLIENGNDLITIVDLDNFVQYLSPSIESIMGYAQADLMGKDFMEHVDEKDLDALGAHLSQLKEERNLDKTYPFEFKYLHANGNIRTLECYSRYMKQSNGVELIIMNSRDITDRNKTQELLKQKNDELEQFIYRASHDLKGPLASTLGLVNIAKSEVKDEVSLNYIGLIEQSAKRLDSILLDLLMVTQITKGDLKLSKVDMETLVKDVVDGLRHRPDFGDVKIDIKTNRKVEFYTDPKVIYSVLLNLIDNGIKYKDDKKDQSHINIVMKMIRNRLEVTVEDNGLGIPQKAQDKIFDMFYRASDKAKGSGLGLYIVQNAVNKLDGTIELSSEFGKGSRFIINFPNLIKQKRGSNEKAGGKVQSGDVDRR